MYRLLDKLSKSKRKKSFPQFKRILFLRPDRLGDVLLTFPAVYNVKSAFPAAEIYYLCREYTSPIIKSYIPVNDVLVLPENQDKESMEKLTADIIGLNFDLAIHLLPKASLARIIYKAKIRYRLGMGYRLYSIYYNLRQFEHRKYNEYHEAEYNLRMLSLLNISTAYSENSYNNFSFSTEDEENSKVIIRKTFGAEPFILIHPGSGGSSLDWPLDHFIQLIRLLNEWNTFKIGVTGVESERTKLTPLLNSELHFVDLVGKLDMIQLALVSRQASIFVANSTGPLHLAVAMGTPVLGFYPAAYDLGPKRWGPFGRPAGQVITPNDMLSLHEQKNTNLNMASITPRSTFIRIREILGNDNE